MPDESQVLVLNPITVMKAAEEYRAAKLALKEAADKARRAEADRKASTNAVEIAEARVYNAFRAFTAAVPPWHKNEPFPDID